MPVSLRSRYAKAPVYEAPDSAGETHATIGIRISAPPPGPGDAAYRHIVAGAETIEYLAYRYFGTSDAWWRIADANGLVFPLDLPTGAAVVIPPAPELGRVVRDRRF